MTLPFKVSNCNTIFNISPYLLILVTYPHILLQTHKVQPASWVCHCQYPWTREWTNNKKKLYKINISDLKDNLENGGKASILPVSYRCLHIWTENRCWLYLRAPPQPAVPVQHQVWKRHYKDNYRTKMSNKTHLQYFYYKWALIWVARLRNFFFYMFQRGNCFNENLLYMYFIWSKGLIKRHLWNFTLITRANIILNWQTLKFLAIINNSFTWTTTITSSFNV